MNGNANQISEYGNKLALAINQLKQPYAQATSQMEKYGIKPNWEF